MKGGEIAAVRMADPLWGKLAMTKRVVELYRELWESEAKAAGLGAWVVVDAEQPLADVIETCVQLIEGEL